MRLVACLVVDLLVAADLDGARLVPDFFAGRFFAGDFAAADTLFAGLPATGFFERVGAIRSLHLDYQMYQMRVRVEQLSSLGSQFSMVGCVIVPA